MSKNEFENIENAKNKVSEEIKYDERGREQVKAWYALVVFPGREIKIREKLKRLALNDHLKEQIFRIVVPATKEEKVDSKGKTKIKENLIYTQYVYIEMILNDDTYHAVKIDGVRHILGAPTPIPEYDMKEIYKMMDEEYESDVAVVENKEITIGDEVTIVESPMVMFVGKKGIVETIEKEDITVLVQMDGQEVTATVKREQLFKK